MTETFRKPKIGKKEKVIKNIQTLVGVSSDPCKYLPSNELLTNTLVGIEVELENVGGIDFDVNEFRAYWNVVEDGSLRDSGLEFVLSRPFAGEDLITALSIFDKTISKNGKKIRVSERTSVHVHIDVRELTYEQLLRFISLYSTFEEALFRVAGGGNRKNGIFSTSLANAEGYLAVLGRYGKEPDNMTVTSNVRHFSKYSACNVGAVGKYGSLEFRNHEGTYDTARILRWVNILLSLRKAAVENETDIEGIFENISNNGAERVFKDVFGKYSEDMLYPDLEFDMFNGLRLAQDIIHSANLYQGIEVPKAEDKMDTPFTTFYRKKNKDRFNKRIKSFLGGGADEMTFEVESDYGGIAAGLIGERIGRAPRPLRMAVGDDEAPEMPRETIELEVNEGRQQIEVEIG